MARETFWVLKRHSFMMRKQLLCVTRLQGIGVAWAIIHYEFSFVLAFQMFFGFITVSSVERRLLYAMLSPGAFAILARRIMMTRRLCQ